ncbi:hypothetical protein AQUCO_00400417v1 [Aquilegia coerulea]|uniref:Uncharacterized protein n=1 Tax=Aquilegia coerulea TaxID=218851 RepID=A0A2G5EUW8_AQUCA|nr:hypothetical protein AQUCO_00400417v1 [Aquilegia coerulea]
MAQNLESRMISIYVHVGWPLYRKYGHAFEAFELIVAEPDSILSTLTREVTKVIPAMSDDVKDSLIRNIKRRMTPQPLKIRADAEMKCFQFDGVLHIKIATFVRSYMRKAQAAGNKDCPVKIKLVAAPLRLLTSLQSNIESHKGKLTVKQQARAVSERDDKLLAEAMAKLGTANEEVGGDEDSEEEEDTGMGEIDIGIHSLSILFVQQSSFD